MNTKNFIVGSIVGSIVYFLLGWLVYGILFKDIYSSEEFPHSLLFVFLGCLFFASLVSYVFVKWANITQWTTGAKGGAIIGFFYSASMNFYIYSGMEVNYRNIGLDVVLSIIIGAIVGAVIAFVIGKMK